MTYNAKQGLQTVVAKQHCMLSNDVIFRKTKLLTLKKKDRWMFKYWWLFKWSLIENGYTLDFHFFGWGTYPRILSSQLNYKTRLFSHCING